jgi:hypothetical protein
MRSTTSCPSSSVAAAVCPWGLGYGLEGANTDGWGRCCRGSCQRRRSPLIGNKGGGDGGIGTTGGDSGGYGLVRKGEMREKGEMGLCGT